MEALPIPRATIHQLAEHRNAVLADLNHAHEAILEANQRIENALDRLRQAAPAHEGPYTRWKDEELFPSFKAKDAETFADRAQQIVDRDVWTHLIRSTDLDRLMDSQAKEQLRRQLQDDPAPFAADTAYATLETFVADAGNIFRRGIANVFSSLDRRFRTHNGFTVGSRVILTSVFDEMGHWSYRRRHRDILLDIERTFFVLDDRDVPPSYAGIAEVIDVEKRKAFGRRSFEVSTEYFTVRTFKNGNAHLWFKRADLVEKVNRLLAEFFGATVGDSRVAEPDPLAPNQKVARTLNFFPTPQAVADRIIDAADLMPARNRGLSVLEPSAGTGNLSRQVAENGHLVSCIEINSQMAHNLETSGLYQSVQCADFMSIEPPADREQGWDRVIMNPPFEGERDIDHVVHALKFLKPGGVLVAVMSAHTEFAGSRKAQAFRKLVSDGCGHFFDLPIGAFAEVGTNVNTLLLKIRGPWS